MEIILLMCLFFAFLCGFSFILGLIPIDWESRPRLQVWGAMGGGSNEPPKKDPWFVMRKVAIANKPFAKGPLGKRIAKDLIMGQVNMTPEEFFLLKELSIVGTLLLTSRMVTPEMFSFWLMMSFAAGYMIPEYWLRGRVKKVKGTILKELPDAIDLLRLCVNAGLDFMLALKWVVEKSAPSVLIKEFNTIMQEINLGKTRRDAIRDLAVKYDLPDLSTLARTLIQADKMGTSVAEALNILSEDMRLSRFRRGEQMALKAPLKLLVPLLLFIMPVVGILVAGPIFLDFIENNPMDKLMAH